MADAEGTAIFTFAIVIIAGIIAGRAADYYKFPKTIPLIFTGIFISLISGRGHLLLDLDAIREIAVLVAELALIVILFNEGMHLNLTAVKKHLVTITIMAFIGTIVTTVIVGSIIAIVLSYSLVVALLIGAVFTPTDPAATFSILRSGTTQVEEKYETILGGESALNDVVAIILVVVVLIPAVVASQDLHAEVTISLSILIEAFWQFFGGILVGIIIGIGSLLFIRTLPTQIEESVLTAGAAFLIFALGFITGTSGPIGALVAGIIIANPRALKFPDYSKNELFTFWAYITFIFEIFAFIFVGIVFSDAFLDLKIVSIAIVFSVIILLGRLLGIFLITGPLEAIPKFKEEFNNKERIFISFAGSKGLTTAILASLAFVAMENNSILAPLGEIILYSSVMVIIITGTFQALFLKPLAKKTQVLAENTELDEIMAKRVVLKASLDYLVENIQNQTLKPHDLFKIAIPLREHLYEIREKLLMMQSGQKDEMRYIELSLKINDEARSALVKAIEQEEISEIGFQKGLESLESDRIELLRHLESNLSGETIESSQPITDLLEKELALYENEIKLLINAKHNKFFSNELPSIKTKLKSVKSQITKIRKSKSS